MYLKKCFCGESQKNFKVDIGPGYQADCCEKAGFNHKGEKNGKPAAPKKPAEMSKEEVMASAMDAPQAKEEPKEEAKAEAPKEEPKKKSRRSKRK